MADLADLDHVYGEDLGQTLTGDIATVTKYDRTIQRVIRRLMTVATSASGSAYPWDPTYGAGLGYWIGRPLDLRAIAASVRSQMLMEPTVAKTPAPQVTVEKIDIGASISVVYTDNSGQPQTFSFDLSP